MSGIPPFQIFAFSDKLPSKSIGERDVRFVSEIRAGRSFYRLVGTAEQCGRDSDAESLCGLKVDKQVNFRGLLHR